MIANSDQTHRKGRKRHPNKRRRREKRKRRRRGEKKTTRNGPTWKTCVTKTKIIYET